MGVTAFLLFACLLTFFFLANEDHDTNSWRATLFKDTNIPFALQYWIAFTMTEGVENRASGGDSFYLSWAWRNGWIGG